LRPQSLDYAARFLKKCDEICGIFMQFYSMKLRELAKNAATHFITFPRQQGEMAALV
jgi:hypothetical protein